MSRAHVVLLLALVLAAGCAAQVMNVEDSLGNELLLTNFTANLGSPLATPSLGEVVEKEGRFGASCAIGVGCMILYLNPDSMDDWFFTSGSESALLAPEGTGGDGRFGAAVSILSDIPTAEEESRRRLRDRRGPRGSSAGRKLRQFGNDPIPCPNGELPPCDPIGDYDYDPLGDLCPDPPCDQPGGLCLDPPCGQTPTPGPSPSVNGGSNGGSSGGGPGGDGNTALVYLEEHFTAIAVGAPGSGSVHVYGVWGEGEEAELDLESEEEVEKPDKLSLDDGFGEVVELAFVDDVLGAGENAVWGLTLYVGSPRAYGGQGTVHIYCRRETGFRLIGEATSPDTSARGFGSTIAVPRLDYDRLVVGAPGAGPQGTEKGGVWVFYNLADFNDYSEVRKLPLGDKPDDLPDLEGGARFGEAISILPVSDDELDIEYILAVGAPGARTIFMYSGTFSIALGRDSIRMTNVVDASGVRESTSPMILGLLPAGEVFYYFKNDPGFFRANLELQERFLEERWDITSADDPVVTMHTEDDPVLPLFLRLRIPYIGQRPDGVFNGGMNWLANTIALPGVDSWDCKYLEPEHIEDMAEKCSYTAIYGLPDESELGQVFVITAYTPPAPPPRPPPPPPPPPIPSKSSGSGTVIGVAVGGGVAALILAALALYCRRRMYPKSKEGQAESYRSTDKSTNSFDVESGKGGSTYVDTDGNSTFGSLPPGRDSAGAASATTISDMMTAADSGDLSSLGKMAWPSSTGGGIYSVPFNELRLIKKLDAGSFKTVYKGTWNANAVAITQVSLEMVNHEVSIMANLSRHPNLVQLFGLSKNPENGDTYLVMELLPHGSLIKLLHSHAAMLGDEKTRLMISSQVCSGMTALAAEGIVHADLACRNVLVQTLDPIIVKVGDFGLSKTNTLYYGAHDKIPYRWSAPEVMEKGKWTEKSDVWAFGVTLWEVYTGGNIPYGFGRQNLEVESLVIAGGMLERPAGDQCPDYMWELMKSCFAFKEDDRPSFLQIMEMLTNHLERLEEGEVPNPSREFNKTLSGATSLRRGQFVTSGGTLSFNFENAGRVDSNNYIKSSSSKKDPNNDSFKYIGGINSLISDSAGAEPDAAGYPEPVTGPGHISTPSQERGARIVDSVSESAPGGVSGTTL